MVEKGIMEIGAQLIPLAQQIFGHQHIEITLLKGDGSDRKIFRLYAGTEHIIGVIHQNTIENKDFLFLTSQIQQLKIPVANILAVSSDHTAYLVEDLGEKNLAEWIDLWKQEAQEHKILPAYQRVLDFLPRIQSELPTLVGDYLMHRTMGRETYLEDLAYFKRNFLNRFGFDAHYSARVAKELEDHLVGKLSALDNRYFVYRDFQSRNIMWHNETPAFIDYQSAFLGPLYYDISSLLYSSKSGLTESARECLLVDYYNKMELTIHYATFLRFFYGFVLLRRLRSLGSYGFLAMEKKKARFRDSIAPTLAELGHILESQNALHEYPETTRMIRQIQSRWRDQGA